MKNSDNRFRPQQAASKEEGEKGKSSRRRFIILSVLGGGAALAECQGKYISQSIELAKYNSSLSKLLEVKDYFKKNAERLARSARRVRNRPWGAYREIRDVNLKLKEAIAALDDLFDSDIRFHPQLFKEAIEIINKAVRKLSRNSKIQDLHEYADSFKRSRRWTGTIDWLGSLKVDTSAVIALSRAVKSLKWYLLKTKKKMLLLTDDSIEGYSNNFAVNLFVKNSMSGR